MSEAKHRTVTLEAQLSQPALTPAAFDLFRTNAAACGLPDIGKVTVHLTVEVEGVTEARHVQALRERLLTLWFGQIDTVEVAE